MWLKKVQTLRKAQRLTALVFTNALVFTLFFHLNKHGPLGEINPFAQDPYDAVGSFAFQIALLVGALSLGRAVRLPEQANRLRLVLRGNMLVMLAVLATLAADQAALFVRMPGSSPWEQFLLAEMGLVWLLSLSSAALVLLFVLRTPLPAAPLDLTLADAIDDLLALARLVVQPLRGVLPEAWVHGIEGISSDRLFARLPWLDPRLHTWRFAALTALLVGVGLALAHLQEGLPANLQVFALASAIFLGAETAAAMIGFTLFGGFLGLRPPLLRQSS